MSGLVYFFRDFLPSEMTEGVEKEDMYDLTLGSYQDQDQEEEEEEDEEENNNNINETEKQYANNNDESVTTAAESNHKWVSTFEEWCTFQIDIMSLYFEARMYHAKDDDDDDDDDDDEEEDHFDDYESIISVNDDNDENDHDDDNVDEDEDDMVWDTQQQDQNGGVLPTSGNHLNNQVTTTTTIPSHGSSSPIEQKKRRIPHISQAVNYVHHIEDIDMYTKEVSMDLCQIRKIWGLRETRRVQNYNFANGPNKKIQCYESDGRMPRIRFGSKEEDGPLAPFFDHVLSIEVVQWIVPSTLTTTTTTTIQNQQQQQQQPTMKNKNKNNKRTKRHHHQHRLRIFFYNEYAIKMNQWIQKMEYLKLKKSGRSDELYISFHFIPSICIFPFASEYTNFLDREELIHYCFCIGGQTTTKLKVLQPITTITTTPTPITITNNNNNNNNNNDDDPQKNQFLGIRLDEVPKLSSSSSSSSTSLLPEVRVAVWDGGFKENTHELKELLLSKESLEEHNNNNKNTSTSNASRSPSSAHVIPTYAPSPLAVALEKWKKLTEEKENHHHQQQQEHQDSSLTNTEKIVTTQGPRETTTTATTTNIADDDETAADSTPAAAAAAASTESNGLDQSGSNSNNNAAGSRIMQQRNINGASTTNSSSLNVPLETADDDDNRPAKRGRVDRTTILLQGGEIPTPRVSISGSIPMEYVKLNKLAEKLSNNKKTINAYGVVLGFRTPFMSKGGDWMATVSLVDDSLCLPEVTDNEPGMIAQITLNIFSRTFNDLPKFYRMGDVLRMHRVELKEFNGEYQLTGFKKKSAFIICRQDGVGEMRNFPVACQHYTWTNEDRTRSQELWEWGQARLLSRPTIRPQNRGTLGQIFRPWSGSRTNNNDGGSGSYRDLTVMVTGIIPLEHSGGGRACGVLRVWDGTGVSESDRLPTNSEAALASIRNGDPPVEVLEKLALIVEGLKREASCMDDLAAPGSLCGRVVNAFIWEKADWDLVNSALEVGSLIRLRNVSYEQGPDFTRINVHDKSAITPVPDLIHETRIILEDHHRRLGRNESSNLSAGILPRIDGAPEGVHPRAAVHGSTPHDLGSFASLSPLGKFTGTVHMELDPPDLARDPGSLCRQRPGGSGFSYRFGVKVWDDTSDRVGVIVSEAAAVKLLGMPASETMSCGSRDVCGKLLDTSILWKVTLQSIECRGRKYLFLSDVSPL